MVVEDMHNSNNPHISVYAPAEMITCSVCGREYVSRGKYDIGICRDCERKMAMQNAPCVGGPLDGQVIR